jgi:hypothetical protein
MLKKDKKKSEWKPHLSVSLLAKKPTNPGPPLPRSTTTPVHLTQPHAITSRHITLSPFLLSYHIHMHTHTHHTTSNSPLPFLLSLPNTPGKPPPPPVAAPPRSRKPNKERVFVKAVIFNGFIGFMRDLNWEF